MARGHIAIVLALSACAPEFVGGDDDRGKCDPGAAVCSDDVSSVCKPDGSGWVDEYCDPVQGLGCDIDTGRCGGECSKASLGDSYIGCDYYATVTGNHVQSTEFHFAVVISNTSEQSARVQIDGGALTESLIFDVAPLSVEVRKLPWVALLKACINEWDPNPFLGDQCGRAKVKGALEVNGAYHVRSDQPVTVYQFSPLNFVNGGSHSYTNDASLLIPSNAMGDEYYVAAWPAWDLEAFIQPGFVAITATWDGTVVTITTTASTEADNFAPAFEAGVPQTVVLDRGDVLELMNFEGDLTGTHVRADRPIQVIGGHYCTQVPIGVAACDHLEESMFPLHTLGNHYVVTAPALPSMPAGKPQVVRVIAVQDDTRVEFEPNVIPAVTLELAGDFVEIPPARDFEISASHRVLVAQYMMGLEAGGDSGDPAMALAVDRQQFRRDYQFHAPLTYDVNYVNVVAPTGARVELDGSAVTGFTPVGSGDFSVARVVLGVGRDGDHVMEAEEPFGITVYGYGEYTSYWYPGGLDLRPIVIP